MPKSYRIKLSAQEREELTELTRRKRAAAHKVCKARSMLLSDEGDFGPAMCDTEIVSKTGIVLRTLERLRKRCHEVGPLQALEAIPRPLPPRAPALNDEQEAQLVRLACSEPPEGCAKWTLRLFAGKLVELEIVESISHETVRKVLKKTNSNLG
jgi:hypothetical protein